MSGTSADGIDAVAVRFTPGRAAEVVTALSQPYPELLRAQLLALGTEDAAVTPRQWATLDAEVGALYAALARRVLDALPAGTPTPTVIGMHGQTVFHAPGLNSLQIGDPNRVAAATALPVVADLRRRDLAEAGQGAPLVPAFHADAFGSDRHPRVIVNIGGIANLTLLPAGGQGVLGFDTGPGNTLLDSWHAQHRGGPFDAGGQWARSGSSLPALLDALRSEPYFQRVPPKSTGRGHFNLRWCRHRWPSLDAADPADVQRTLLELTATSIADAVAGIDAGQQAEVYICGGGTRNDALVQRLADCLAPRPVTTTAALGLDPQHVEAAAFAWLALRRIDGISSNLPAVTGARRAVTLGSLYAG